MGEKKRNPINYLPEGQCQLAVDFGIVDDFGIDVDDTPEWFDSSFAGHQLPAAEVQRQQLIG